MSGHVKIVRLLLDKEAQCHCYRQTWLQKKAKQTGVVKLLIFAKVNVNARDVYGQTALDLVVTCSAFEPTSFNIIDMIQQFNARGAKERKRKALSKKFNAKVS